MSTSGVNKGFSAAASDDAGKKARTDTYAKVVAAFVSNWDSKARTSDDAVAAEAVKQKVLVAWQAAMDSLLPKRVRDAMLRIVQDKFVGDEKESFTIAWGMSL